MQNVPPFTDDKQFIIAVRADTGEGVHTAHCSSLNEAAVLVAAMAPSHKDKPIQVVEFNPTEGYCQDVTEDLKRKLPAYPHNWGSTNELKTTLVDGLIVFEEIINFGEKNWGGGKRYKPTDAVMLVHE